MPLINLNGTEKFKSEEERIKFIDSIPDVTDPTVLKDLPTGMTLEDFTSKIAQTAELAMGLEVDETAGKSFDELVSPEAPAAAPEPSIQPNVEPQVPTQNQEPQQQQQPEPAVPSFDQTIVERRLNNIHDEYAGKLKTKDDEISKLREEMQEKLDALKPKETTQEESTFEPGIESQLKNNISRAKQIALELKSEDDLYGDRAQALLREQSALSAETMELTHTKTEHFKKVALEKAQQAHKLAEQIKSENEAEATARKEREAQDAETAKQKKEWDDYYSLMDKFKEASPAFKGVKKSYEQMQTEYVDFTTKVASIYSGKLPEEITADEREVAFAKYKNGLPELIERVKSQGVVAPETLDTYAVLSEIGTMYRGFEFDQATGQWNKLTNAQGIQIGFPDVSAAYDHYLRKTGKKEEELVNVARSAVENFRKASDTRSNPVELDNAYQQGTVDQMSEKRAAEILNDNESYDAQEMKMIARKGELATDREKLALGEFNKAMKAVGLPPVTAE